MSDFMNLSAVHQASVQVKLDGFIEGCFHVSRAYNIGLTEALDLTLRALLRELAAHKFDPDLANEIWLAASSQLLPDLSTANAPSLN